jgi:pimeloyl-ACP methyl ester carboxylesterase
MYARTASRTPRVCGWPWTYWDWNKVVGPLADPVSFGGDPADAFDLIVPSLPGFGISTPLSRPDMNFWKIADLFHRLMTDIRGRRRTPASRPRRRRSA